MADISIREAYGEALVKYGKDDERVVVLDADVSGSTKSGIFKKACPERFFNVGIAEANMAAMAAGFASAGKIPFINTFAVFLTSIGLLAAREYGSYSRLPIKFAGAYGGMSDAFDGPSHHALEDIGIMRTLPNFKVFVASTARQTEWLVKNAIGSDSPMYIRLSRDVLPELYDEGEKFQEGKSKLLREGSDVTIFACGLMVSNALEAAKILSAEGIEARVVDMFSIKPLDTIMVLESAIKTGKIVTAEEHNVVNGLGSAVASLIAEAGVHAKIAYVGMQDRHGETGPYKKLQHKYGLDAEGIAAKTRDLLTKI